MASGIPLVSLSCARHPSLLVFTDYVPSSSSLVLEIEEVSAGHALSQGGARPIDEPFKGQVDPFHNIFLTNFLTVVRSVIQ